MEIERISICKEQCINEDCKNLHLNDPQLNYKIIMEKAKYQIVQYLNIQKCQKGEACKNRGMCLDIHDGEIIPIFCEKKNCDKIDCIFTHEDDKFHSEIYQEKQQNTIEEANNFKNQGNQFFQENQYLQAIDSFTKAIQLNNKNSIYYSNRAMCYKKLKEWNNSLSDAQSALSLDFQNLRARYLITISYIEIMKNEKNIAAIDILTKSLYELEKIEKEAFLVQNLNFQNLNPEKQKVKYLIELYSKFQLEYTLLNVIERSFRPKEDKEKLQNLLWQKIQVFQNKPANKPEYMICPLTLTDFEEPIITTFGQTYEKTALFQHFKTNGHFDPITRNQINKNCIPNLQLVQAIQDFNKAKHNATLTMENIEFD